MHIYEEMKQGRDVDALSDLAQAVSDVYAARFGIERDAAWHLGKLSEELGELQAAYLKRSGRGRGAADQEALEDEVADLFAQVLLFARWQGVDIPSAVARKWGRHAPGEGG